MRRLIVSYFAVIASVTACSGGEIAVGKTEQQLQTKKDGGATGDGQTCSWDDTVAYDAVSGTTTTTPASGGYAVGDTFESPDGCNHCSCSADGILCTTRLCTPESPGQGCTEEAKVCPDGSSVGRTGPNCEFSPCPGPQACTEEAKQCPDGSYVARTGPSCEFAPCPTGGATACPADAKLCPDGSSVGREGPNCTFAPCP